MLRPSIKRCLITGGSGYIGSHLARYLRQVQPSAEIMVIDWNLRAWAVQDADHVYGLDFASSSSLEIIRDWQPDTVMHCAASHIVPESVRDPSSFYHNNVIRTWQLLEVLRDLARPPQVLFSSTAAVYGETQVLPITEEHPTVPCNPYGRTKLAIEGLLHDYWQAYQIPSVCFRYFNAAGAEPLNHDLGQAPGATHIIARLLESAHSGQEFTLYGQDYPTLDGTCQRDYIHVWDIARAHVQALDYLLEHPGAAIMNLGTSRGVSNQEIIDLVVRQVGPVKIKPGPRRAGDPAELVASAERARRLLGWQPLHSSIDEIVDSANRWYQKILTAQH